LIGVPGIEYRNWTRAYRIDNACGMDGQTSIVNGDPNDSAGPGLPVRKRLDARIFQQLLSKKTTLFTKGSPSMQ
jgi:hypothetical protein